MIEDHTTRVEILEPILYLEFNGIFLEEKECYVAYLNSLIIGIVFLVSRDSFKLVRLDLEYVMTYSNKLTCITISFLDNKLYEASGFFFFFFLSWKLVLYKFKCGQ